MYLGTNLCVATSPQMQMLQQAKQNQMQRDPSNMNANQDRPSSPASGENAPSPSKRQRIDGAPFNPNQPGAMMANGRPGQVMAGQQMAAAHQMLTANGINPNSLNPQQLQNFANAPPAAQQKSIATYSQNLQQHHGNQMGNKQMPNAGGPQNQGSPMMAQGPDGNALNAFYNPGEMAPGGMRQGPAGAQAGAGSNHALQDYQMQLMLLEQQNKKRLMMARQEQDSMGGIPRDGQGAPTGPNGQPFPDTSPQAMRTGTSPNPAEQMKRGTPQMNNSGIPSPVPEGGQSRGSPNPAMNFMGNHVDPNMAPHFFKGMEGNMAAAQAQMNGMRPPSSHPGQPFNGAMNAQMMARHQQQQQQQQGQPQQQQQGQPQPQQPGQGNPQQWQQGPNGQMIPQGMQPGQQVQGTPQQRSMPPPSAPAGGNGNQPTASPQQTAVAPPTPNQTNKAGPKKKDTKSAKDKVSARPCLPLLARLTCSYSAPLHRRNRIQTSITLAPPLLATTMGTQNHRLRPLPSPLSTLSTPAVSTRTGKLEAPQVAKQAVRRRLLQQYPHKLLQPDLHLRQALSSKRVMAIPTKMYPWVWITLVTWYVLFFSH